MNVSLAWLRELVPSLEGDAEEVARELSMTAVAVDEVVPVGRGLDDLRVARVVEAAPHPDADRLTLCRVDAGGEEVEVVCGAPEVLEDTLYPYVPPGGELPDGTRIEAREIRGRASHGMLCSEAELGLGADAGGIMALPAELEVGAPLGEALALPDARLVLDLTPNRVDLACHVGVARELAPADKPELHLRDFGGAAWEPRWSDGEATSQAAGVRVEVEDPERCRRYLGAVIRGVEVGRSPAWLAGRLRAVGARPVNNVVDATNYVLREMNQPLHAFDLARLEGPDVSVRAARDGEELRTLDGRDRELSDEMTVIADASGPVGLAGVMGGEDSEVGPATTDVFLECAWFDPGATRRTARSAELATDASYRFEREIDPTLQERALRRCVELILAVAGGEAADEAVRVGGPAPGLRSVDLRPSRVEQVLGRQFSPGELDGLLSPLGFDLAARGEGEAGEDAALRVRVPGWRSDVTREVDLVEEVARRHGYERFPSDGRAFRPSAVPDDREWQRAERIHRLMEARGLLETRSSSLVAKGAADPRGPVKLLHPLAADQSYLRGAIVPVLLRRLEHNYSRGVGDVRLYEIGTAFRRAGEGEEAPARLTGGEAPETTAAVSRYREDRRVGAVLTGDRHPEHWSEESRRVDLWDLKGLAADLTAELRDGGLEPGADEAAVEAFAADGWLGPERFRIMSDGDLVGVAGRVREEAVDAPPWGGPVWALEVRLEAVDEAPRPTHRELSAFPPVHRDLAVTVAREVPAAEAERAARAASPDTLERIELFDRYEGEGVPEGRTSLAFRFRFRAPDRTLEDREVEEAMEAIMEALRETCDARVRTG